MPLNVKDFGARGDGGTDDTAAIQLALDALMAVYRGGTLYFPAGIYMVKYTLQLVGDPAHNYTIIGDGGGLTSITTLKWAGPAKCTMLDCWGLNWTQFKGLVFDGGGINKHIGGSSDPSVGTVGAVVPLGFIPINTIQFRILASMDALPPSMSFLMIVPGKAFAEESMRPVP